MFLVVTGMSGAGKSTVLNVLEDTGFFCIDNMPPELIPKFAELCCSSNTEVEKVAFGIDIRGRRFFAQLFQTLQEMKNSGFEVQILFMEAADAVLIKRFKETRRRHPLLDDTDEPQAITRTEQALALERQMLQELKKRANYVLDTTSINTWQLKEEIRKTFVEGQEFKSLMIHIVSFGFKHGIPMDSDMVYDVRFIPNPFYIPEMRELTGNDRAIQEYVMKWDVSKEFLDRVTQLVTFLIPHYIKEGKNQLVISIGCTGGKHRSVTMANMLSQTLKQKGHRVFLFHRDLEKDGKPTV